jgi:hypothetical protein
MTRSFLIRPTLLAVMALLSFGILTLWVPHPWATAALELGALAAGLTWSVLIALNRASAQVVSALAPLGCAALWPLVQLTAGSAIYAWNTWDSLWTWAVYLVFFFLALQVATDPHYLLRFLQAALYFSFALSVISSLQMFTSGGKVFWLFESGYQNYVLGPFVYQNQYAAFIELMLPLPLYFSLIERKHSVRYSAMAAVMAGSVIASASRAGSILVVAECIAVPLLARRVHIASRRKAMAMCAVTAGLTAAAVLVVGGAALAQRFAMPDPFYLRRELLVSSLHMLVDRPLLGFGLGNWAVAYPGYAIFDPGVYMNQAHNDWLQWAVEGGVPFAAFMLLFAFLVARPALRSVWGVGVLVVCLHCLVDYPLQQRPALACLFFAIAGAVASLSRTPWCNISTRVQGEGIVQARAAEDHETRRHRIVEVR